MKLLLVMKLTGLFLLISVLSIAGNSYAQNMQFDLNVKDASIVQVLEKIEEVTEFGFLFKTDQLDTETRYSLNLKSVKIDKVMDEVLDKELYSYKIMDKIIVVSKQESNNNIDQNQKEFRGKVTDSNGAPLPGVTVLIKGTTTGTTTNMDGEFVLKNGADEGVVLQFSFIGMKTQEIVPGDKTELTVVMEEDAIGLEEVVAIGYGVQKKSVVTAAISRITTDELNIEKPTNVQNAMKGKISGVQITSNSGQPGSNSKIYIRGVGTVNDASPLYVIDGMPSSNGINYLNPSDIASIEILKDAASAAIYGARGANGVVLVTTKSGKTNQKAVFSYEYSYGFQNPEKETNLLGSSDYQMLMNEMGKNSGRGDDFYFPTASDVNTKWQDVLTYDNAPIQNHKMSLSGGTEKSTYYASFSILDQSGIFAKGYSDFERYNARLNVSNVLVDTEERHWLNKIVFGAKTSYTYSKTKGSSIGNSEAGGIIASMNMLPPTEPVYQTNPAQIEMYKTIYPNYLSSPDGQVYNIINMREIVNPLAALQARNNSLNEPQIFNANLDLTFTLLPDLIYKTTADFEWSTGASRGYTPKYDLNTDQKNVDAYVWNSLSRGKVWQWENTLNYTKSIGKNNFVLLAGTSIQSGFWQWMNGTRYDPIDLSLDKAFLDISGASAGDSRDRVSGSASDSKMQSFFGRLSYNYDEKYMLETTVRRDGSSNFGPNHKYGTFPSVSAGWVISREDFMQNTSSWLNFAKLRLSWGQNGNDRIGAFGYTTTIVTGNYRAVIDNVIMQGAKPSGYSNPDLKWETSEQTDLGIDLRFLNSSLSITADYFNKKTKDMLFDLPLPDYAGYASIKTNTGTVSNKGIEMDASYRFNIGKANFGVAANASYVKNEVIDQGDSNVPVSIDGIGGGLGGSVTWRANGYPYGFYYGYESDGIYQNQAEVDAAIQENAVVGGIRWKDTDDNGHIDGGDRTMIGKPNPDWTYGFSINGDYANFDFSVLFQGVQGNEIYKLYRRGNVTQANFDEAWLGRWHGEGTSNKYPILYEGNITPTGGDTGANTVSDLYVEDGSYLRLKVLQIGYTLPVSLTKKALISNLRFYVQGENLLTFTNYTGLDPEVGTRNGFDGGTYPQARTLTLGVNISF
ncbi:TonB-linked outer membrane protein, SusC/RagA family [Draconibacterium orientale]|uniref:TonB-linked outer membrane protein, SusC/RagA family n=2 Tax=Draconibacterium orientale TaxID=1168034 RepID=A0A1I0BDD7_9BACT|nr:TonB-dependent receptor [Draconibacterium orientale]SET04843.1 TonB-linked outer membrane protein, SusC/RagA family [Draconibacterium orientale]